MSLRQLMRRKLYQLEKAKLRSRRRNKYLLERVQLRSNMKRSNTFRVVSCPQLKELS